MRTTITKQQLIEALPIIETSVQAADELSKKLGINKHFFRKLRSLLGYCPERVFKTTPEQRKRVAEKIRKGEYASDIAKEECLDVRDVLYIAKKEHVQINRKRDFWSDIKTMKIINLRNKGYSYPAIARMTGKSANCIREYCNDLKKGHIKQKKEIYEKCGGITFEGRGRSE